MNSERKKTRQDSRRLEAAGEWLLRIQDMQLDQHELACWLKWYEADPANRAAFEKVQQTFESLHGLPKADRAVWSAQILADAERPASNVRKRWSILTERLTSSNGWLVHHRGVAIGLVSMLVVAALIGYWKLSEYDTSSVNTAAYKTERAKDRTITLADGSRVRLGAQSQLFLNFTSQTRFLVLEGGEAFFEVSKDARRPFVVQAGTVTVRAVGTEFNVRRVIDRTEIAVAEGAVDVVQQVSLSTAAPGDPARGTAVARLSTPATIHLKAGEQITMGDTIAALSLKSVEPDKVATWQQGRLEFVDEPLRFVIATVNRYASREIVITDQALNDLQFTGTVSRDRIDEWLNALSDVLPVQVTRPGTETVLISGRVNAGPAAHQITQ